MNTFYVYGTSRYGTRLFAQYLGQLNLVSAGMEPYEILGEDTMTTREPLCGHAVNEFMPEFEAVNGEWVRRVF